jgi:type II secretory pathway component PulJ
MYVAQKTRCYKHITNSAFARKSCNVNAQNHARRVHKQEQQHVSQINRGLDLPGKLRKSELLDYQLSNQTLQSSPQVDLILDISAEEK